MYPLHMHNPAGGGFASANDQAEHQSLSAAGYEPKFVGVEAVAPPAAEPQSQDTPAAAPAPKNKGGRPRKA